MSLFLQQYIWYLISFKNLVTASWRLIMLVHCNLNQRSYLIVIKCLDFIHLLHPQLFIYFVRVALRAELLISWFYWVIIAWVFVGDAIVFIVELWNLIPWFYRVHVLSSWSVVLPAESLVGGFASVKVCALHQNEIQ